eukprot:scaffold501_cov355-Pinguiococcus_pyrenoidosus.AAC.27
MDPPHLGRNRVKAPTSAAVFLAKLAPARPRSRACRWRNPHGSRSAGVARARAHRRAARYGADAHRAHHAADLRRGQGRVRAPAAARDPEAPAPAARPRPRPRAARRAAARAGRGRRGGGAGGRWPRLPVFSRQIDTPRHAEVPGLAGRAGPPPGRAALESGGAGEAGERRCGGRFAG